MQIFEPSGGLKTIADVSGTVSLLIVITSALAWSLWKILNKYLTKLENESNDTELIKEHTALLKQILDFLKYGKRKDD